MGYVKTMYTISVQWGQQVLVFLCYTKTVGWVGCIPPQQSRGCRKSGERLVMLTFRRERMAKPQIRIAKVLVRLNGFAAGIKVMSVRRPRIRFHIFLGPTVCRRPFVVVCMRFSMLAQCLPGESNFP